MPVDYMIDDPESRSVEVWQKHLARLCALPEDAYCKAQSIRVAERRIEQLKELAREIAADQVA